MSSPIGPTLPHPCLLSYVPSVAAMVVKFYWEEKESRWGWFHVQNAQSMSHSRKRMNQILTRCEHPQAVTQFGPTQLMNVVIAGSHLKSTFARVCPKTCPLVNPKATLCIFAIIIYLFRGFDVPYTPPPFLTIVIPNISKYIPNVLSFGAIHDQGTTFRTKDFRTLLH